MAAKIKPALASQPYERSPRLRDALAVQVIEHNPLDAEQVAMFEMFERENWPHDQRRAFLTARAMLNQFETD